MRHSLERVSLYQKELTAPNGCVQAVSSAVPDCREVRPFQFIFSSARCRVGVMMLHGNHGKAGSARPLRRIIIGMKIAYHHLGTEPVKPAKIFDGASKRIASFQRLQVADMLAQANLPPDGDGHRVLRSEERRGGAEG